MTNDQEHGSVERAVRYLGFGRASFMSLKTDDAGRVMPQALERALANATGPVIVILNAADLNVGATSTRRLQAG
jgi:glutamate/tyrosine decarboxylase-like PLP-dependent enzyme